MRLHELLRQYDSSTVFDCSDNPEITGLSDDSRTCQPGDLFFARSGTKVDGLQFVREAVLHGAAAVIAAEPTVGLSVPQIAISGPGVASKIAHLFYGRPSDAMKVLAVTGTNGKTTTTYLIRHILAKAGLKCGVVGTVEIDDGNQVVEASITTPGALDVARIFATMNSNGCDAVAIETSSHALDQGRVAGVRLAAAGFTNLTGDHLDYHGTLDSYADAKARLFTMLDANGVACVNADDAASERMVRDTRGRVVRFGQDGDANYRAEKIEVLSSGTRFDLITPAGRRTVTMQLIGRHNIENALCAASLCGEAFGLSLDQLADALTDATGAPGRLQSVHEGQPFAVLVDYAHTDDALKNVLSALRPITRGKLRVIFGCGGDRDRTKRPRMAKVAESFADAIYVTSDNPRTESPTAIVDEILTGFTHSGVKAITVEPDRRRAIELALTDAEPEDVVLLAGKGHENYQIIGTTKHHFDDVEQCRTMLSSRNGRA